MRRCTRPRGPQRPPPGPPDAAAPCGQKTPAPAHRRGYSIFSPTLVFARRRRLFLRELQAAVNLVAAGIGVATVPASIAPLRADAFAICRLVQPDGAALICADVYVARRAQEERSIVRLLAQSLSEWARERRTQPAR